MKAWHMGTHLIGLSKSIPMNTNMTGFKGLRGFLVPLLKVPLCIEGVNLRFINSGHFDTIEVCEYKRTFLWIDKKKTVTKKLVTVSRCLCFKRYLFHRDISKIAWQ